MTDEIKLNKSYNQRNISPFCCGTGTGLSFLDDILHITCSQVEGAADDVRYSVPSRHKTD